MTARGLVAVLILILVFGIGIALAQPNAVTATVTKANKPVTVTIPAHAVEIADGVFDLGTTVVNGKVVQGYAFVDYKKEFTHKPNHKPPSGGGGTTSCFSLLAKGARWKTTETYVLNTANNDGMTDDFVATTVETGFNAWDNEVLFDIFGPRNTTATVDGADTASPDGKNEVFFADIDSPGAIAVTIVWGIFAGPPSGREIIEFDMVFDHVDFNFGNAGPTSETSLGDTSVMDMQNIATHEDGHAAGLGHPPDGCTEETMYRFASAGETKKRTLNTGDKTGIHNLYGA